MIDYSCPKCGEREIEPCEMDGEVAVVECLSCGHTGHADSFRCDTTKEDV